MNERDTVALLVRIPASLRIRLKVAAARDEVTLAHKLAMILNAALPREEG
jgi:hypothetical protein